MSANRIIDSSRFMFFIYINYLSANLTKSFLVAKTMPNFVLGNHPICEILVTSKSCV